MKNQKWTHLDTNIILDIEKRIKKNSKVKTIGFCQTKTIENIKDLDEDFITYDLKTLSIYEDTEVIYDRKSLKVLHENNKHGYIYTFKF